MFVDVRVDGDSREGIFAEDLERGAHDVAMRSNMYLNWGFALHANVGSLAHFHR